MKITAAIHSVGVNDHQVDLFEGQYPVPHGMAYNSYVIMDEKLAVMDTVDARFGDEWMENLSAALNGRKPDYLIVQHMEPDHSANIARFLNTYPTAKVVATAKAFPMMRQFYGWDDPARRMVAAENTPLCLGTHTLQFVMAPMVHWPEVMVTYDATDKVLFSADGFGKFGALDVDEPWTDEARRYYIGIVGKFGMPVQTLLKKAAALDIQTICPLHGPVLTGDLTPYLSLYQTWSSYAPEEKGVVVAYTSVYGHTRKASLLLAEKLEARGEKVRVYDLARCDQTQAVSDAFRFDRLVLATTTYNGDVFPPMDAFLRHLTARGFQNRRIGLMENGTWAPLAAKKMQELLAACKQLTIAEPTVRILSALDESSLGQLDALAATLCE